MINILILLAVNFGGFVIIYLLLKKRIDRAFASTELLRQVESEIDAVITELNRTTERNITLLEEKIRHLGDLLGKADLRLTLMKKQLERESRTEPVVYTRPLPIYPPKDGGRDGDSPLPGSPPEQPESLLKVQEKPLTQSEKVLLLHRQGVEKSAIASRLGISLGEVDLIVSLGERTKG